MRVPANLARIVTGFAVVLMLSVAVASANNIERFVGTYTGSAVMKTVDGESQPRNLSVKIATTKRGFSVDWTTIVYRSDGREKEKSYSVNFVPSDRDDVFAAAMKKNMFGHEVPLDPMKGEPYVWARLSGDTLTVYSLFVDDMGDYEMQQFDRSLVERGLQLEFTRFRNGDKQRTVSALLERQWP